MDREFSPQCTKATGISRLEPEAPQGELISFALNPMARHSHILICISRESFVSLSFSSLFYRKIGTFKYIWCGQEVHYWVIQKNVLICLLRQKSFVLRGLVRISSPVKQGILESFLAITPLPYDAVFLYLYVFFYNMYYYNMYFSIIAQGENRFVCLLSFRRLTVYLGPWDGKVRECANIS